LIKLFGKTVGTPPGVAEYWNCAVTAVAELVLIIPLSVITRFSLADVDAPVTTKGLIDVLYILWQAARVAPVAVVASATYAILLNALVGLNNTEVV
jgi:hypothetical protein